MKKSCAQHRTKPQKSPLKMVSSPLKLNAEVVESLETVKNLEKTPDTTKYLGWLQSPGLSQQFSPDFMLGTPPYVTYKRFAKRHTPDPPQFDTPRTVSPEKLLSQQSQSLLQTPNDILTGPSQPSVESSSVIHSETPLKNLCTQPSPSLLDSQRSSILARTPAKEDLPAMRKAKSFENESSPQLALDESESPSEVMPRSQSTPARKVRIRQKSGKDRSQMTITECFRAMSTPKAIRRKLKPHGNPQPELIVLEDDDEDVPVVVQPTSNHSPRKSSTTSTKASSSVLNSSYDRVPKKPQANFKYKEVVRKKDERCKLPGHDCACCRDFFESVAEATGKSAVEMKGKLSRHRAKHAAPKTPAHFWDIDFPVTPEKL